MTWMTAQWADGGPYPGDSQRCAELTNPATGQVTGRVASASQHDAGTVITSAAEAVDAWGRTSLSRRSRIVMRFNQLLDERKVELAAILTVERMTGIDVPIPAPVAYYLFGGWMQSLVGDTHALGIDGVHFYRRGKAVTSRCIDPRAVGELDLGFPRKV